MWGGSWPGRWEETPLSRLGSWRDLRRNSSSLFPMTGNDACVFKFFFWSTCTFWLGSVLKLQQYCSKVLNHTYFKKYIDFKMECLVVFLKGSQSFSKSEVAFSFSSFFTHFQSNSCSWSWQHIALKMRKVDSVCLLSAVPFQGSPYWIIHLRVTPSSSSSVLIPTMSTSSQKKKWPL